MNLTCLKKRILFQFIQAAEGGAFSNKTDWGFEIKNQVEDIKTARWAKVLAIGPQVKAVEVGEYILIEPLMWTLSFTHEKVKYWATAEEKVFATSKTVPTELV